MKSFEDYSKVDDGLVEVQSGLVRYFENMFEGRGANKRTGRLYAEFLFTEEKLTQKELSQKLNRNQSTISRDLKYLESTGMIKKERDENSREWLYSTTAESFMGLLNNRIIAATNVLQREIIALEFLKKKWEKLEEQTKSSRKGQSLQEMLDGYIAFMEIMIEELEITVNKLKLRHQKGKGL